MVRDAHSQTGTTIRDGMRDERTIVVLDGDQTGQELLEEALRVLAADVIGIELEFPRFDLSLERRRATSNGVVYEAAAAIREHGLGLKAATVTPEARGDVGSPNRILREEIGGRVIVRTGRRIPGVAPLGGVHAPISIVRMAVGDAYGATEWREGEGDDEVAFRTERIERRICHAVAASCTTPLSVSRRRSSERSKRGKSSSTPITSGSSTRRLSSSSSCPVSSPSRTTMLRSSRIGGQSSVVVGGRCRAG